MIICLYRFDENGDVSEQMKYNLRKNAGINDTIRTILGKKLDFL